MTKTHSLAALTFVNLGMLIFVLLHHGAPVRASESAPVVRAQALEIVDSQGKVRASISVIPEVRRVGRIVRLLSTV
jgi:hypothetical protein